MAITYMLPSYRVARTTDAKCTKTFQTCTSYDDMYSNDIIPGTAQHVRRSLGERLRSISEAVRHHPCMRSPTSRLMSPLGAPLA